MKIVQPVATIVQSYLHMETVIEAAGRACYNSESKICDNSYKDFIEHIKESHHDSVLEHGAITVRIVCDRGVTHELVRHRLASFSQESTRYCNYTKEKFDGQIKIVDISTGFNYNMNNDNDRAKYNVWSTAMAMSEMAYNEMISLGATAQEARSVLPTSTASKIYITANPREWRHIMRMRTAKSAHPQMIEVMAPLLEEFKQRWPTLFGDI